ncbi:hypothetical protein H5T53_07850 [Candidatus Bipolaricaulota bacterium]|nr:hypothetical protein [Candidatus Bipolaricaulota bacterium]
MGDFAKEAARARSEIGRKGWAVIDSRALGERVVLAEDGVAGYPRGMAVYTLSEIRVLAQNPPSREELAALHRAKKLFDGRIRPEGARPDPYDPRPDLPEDSRLWTELLVLAAAEHPEVLEVLREARERGTRLRRKNGRFVLRPQVGERAWPSVEAYVEFRERALSPHAAAVAELLFELSAANGGGER